MSIPGVIAVNKNLGQNCFIFQYVSLSLVYDDVKLYF